RAAVLGAARRAADAQGRRLLERNRSGTGGAVDGRRRVLQRLRHAPRPAQALRLELERALGRGQRDALLARLHRGRRRLLDLHLALQLPHHLGAELLLPPVVGGVRVLDQPGGEELRVEVLALAAGLLLQVLDRDADRVELLEAGPELVEVPVLGVPVARRAG